MKDGKCWGEIRRQDPLAYYFRHLLKEKHVLDEPLVNSSTWRNKHARVDAIAQHLDQLMCSKPLLLSLGRYRP